MLHHFVQQKSMALTPLRTLGPIFYPNKVEMEIGTGYEATFPHAYTTYRVINSESERNQSAGSPMVRTPIIKYED